jgi:pyruvate ferredoxin oxidoreductase gamma subunit
MTELTEIRWHGRGGQGAKTAAQILAETAMDTGAYIQAFPEYGPERAGAPMQAFTRISKTPINIHSGVHAPDVVVVLDPSLLESIDVTEGLKEDGLLLVNTAEEAGEVREKCGCEKVQVATVNATAIALDCLGLPMPNLPMLGALLKLKDLVDLGELEKGIRKKMEHKIGRDKTRANIEGVRKAYEEVKT